MNVEYQFLSDGTAEITNSMGMKKKRRDDISSKKLIIENKIEKVQQEKDDAKEKIRAYEGLVFFSKGNLFTIPIVLFFVVLAVLLTGGIRQVILDLTPTLLTCSPVALLWTFVYRKAKKGIKGYEGRIKKAEELECKYKNELEKEKEKIVEKQANRIIGNQINKIISLEEQNDQELELIEEELTHAFVTAMEAKQKQLVLRKKTKKDD